MSAVPAPTFRLRPVTLDDAALLLRWRNAEPVRQCMYNTAEIALPEHQRWLQRELANPASRHLLLERDGAPVGYASLADISERHRRCTWGFNLGDASQPRGTGLRMLALLAEQVFEVLQLEKICSEVLDFNAASLRVHQRLGFVAEGRLRRHIHRPDGVFDVEVLALFAEDWRRLRGPLLAELFDE
ncbi:UDP-4-amino-4,6-dideoxy-N-acetyl-beta-L-altrosami ne N-acetyltransferase [Pseudomonas sp. No.21]|jgi:UDP-4-amino-4,6-dideoxy-N-acetyl-beta-L-altrosamine N-acetyltransferase|uniref:UDP-4-amino-4, 6-dideoxy-N-acetyl-beta-L-altrosamine N-acetyltransferase n=1 Tax=Pseudomonas tohonis TaxID=2725477 RepID=UPI001F2FC024|nr:UDP-4-amino-4,6-dideoxy-N-acetyl-beta-L-altrosamine N-acetyltransferase [Pseudomonas tohonis]GJN48374.1 UDP-4-amino-4,6-dideoxy-N-acetyl-beta-L-altrosami ne N-acetyltransferase [Pseudomonas tohonis]